MNDDSRSVQLWLMQRWYEWMNKRRKEGRKECHRTHVFENISRWLIAWSTARAVLMLRLRSEHTHSIPVLRPPVRGAVAAFPGNCYWLLRALLAETAEVSALLCRCGLEWNHLIDFRDTVVNTGTVTSFSTNKPINQSINQSIRRSIRPGYAYQLHTAAGRISDIDRETVRCCQWGTICHNTITLIMFFFKYYEDIATESAENWCFDCPTVSEIESQTSVLQDYISVVTGWSYMVTKTEQIHLYNLSVCWCTSVSGQRTIADKIAQFEGTRYTYSVFF